MLIELKTPVHTNIIDVFIDGVIMFVFVVQEDVVLWRPVFKGKRNLFLVPYEYFTNTPPDRTELFRVIEAYCKCSVNLGEFK
jgi:hypothetical protein